MNHGWDLSSTDDDETDVEEQSLLPQTGKKIFPSPSQIKAKTTRDQYSNKSHTLCPYGEKCYRNNPSHFKEYQHSQKRIKHDSRDLNEPKVKRAKTLTGAHPSKSSHSESVEAYNFSLPHYFLLTTVKDIESRFNYVCSSTNPDLISPPSLSLKDILSEKFGKIVKSVQFNYCIDIEWVLEQYPLQARSVPLLIVHGEQAGNNLKLIEEAKAFPNIELCRAELPPYGTHHTKMMFLLYKEGFRVVVGTANLVQQDWKNRTQGLWISPVFKITSGGSQSKNDFQNDLITYLNAYHRKALDPWITIIKNCEMGNVNVLLVGSVPGRHTGRSLNTWGHMKLRALLSRHVKGVDHSWPVVGQFSSIGSLGTTKDKWVCSEWLTSLSATIKQSASVSSKPPLKLIFPTVDNVRQSLDGYPSGASLPYSLANYKKQPWLNKFFYQWNSDHCGRSKASPHIKCYSRISPFKTNVRAAWFLLSSANLSKAAWGCLEKQGSQLAIKSYELGVLFLPSLNLNKCDDGDDIVQNYFQVTPSQKSCSRFPLPFSLPLQPYTNSDEPWTWDSPHKEAPDRFGNIWVPS